jgi:hypothetical protein
MVQASSIRTPQAQLKDTIERLVSENIELRRTAVDIALQTAILKESLHMSRVRSLRSEEAR